ncbi:hypothetical protein TYRP_018289, partial [Tyrophagus putrescentiae]
ESPRINRAFYLLASFCRLELPHKAHEGKEKDPGELLQSDKFIALWKRQLFLLLKTPIKKLDKEGSFIDYNRLFFCSKVMIINLEECNRWRVVDTAALPINESSPPMIANMFKWDGEGHLNRRKNVVNSVWLLNLETLKWSCLNNRKKAVRQRARNVAIADGGKLKKVTTPSINDMAIAANADGLWILHRRDIDVPLDPYHPVKTEFFYVPFN